MEAASVGRGALLALSLVVPPGPVNVAQFDAGLGRGWLASLSVGLGATLAIGVYATLAVTGGALLASLPALRIVLWAVGTALLAGYGLMTLRGALSAAPPPGPGAFGRGHPFVLGYAMGLFNPMALALLVAVAGGAGGVDAGFLVGFVGAMVLWNVGLASFSAAGGRTLTLETVRGLRLAAGLALLAYAGYFAFWAAGRPPGL